jgi:predicted DNA-binding transcriptional regulator AlpA
MNKDTLLTERDLAVYIGLSLPTLQRMRAAGTGPQFVQLSQRRIAYRRSAVDAWLAARTTDRIGGIDIQQRVVPQPFTSNGEAA